MILAEQSILTLVTVVAASLLGSVVTSEIKQISPSSVSLYLCEGLANPTPVPLSPADAAGVPADACR